MFLIWGFEGESDHCRGLLAPGPQSFSQFQSGETSQVNAKSRFTPLGGKIAMCRGGRQRAQGLVHAGVVPTTPRFLERAKVRREMSHLLVVLCRPGIFCSFSLLRCVGFSRASVLKFQFKGSW